MFLNESFLFLAIQALGLYVGYTISQYYYIPQAETTSSVVSFLIAFIIATVALILLLKFFKGKIVLTLLLGFLIFMGSEAVFSIFMPERFAIAFALGIVFLRFLIPNVITQNLSIGLAIAGIGASLGLMLSLPAILIILAILSVYDVIAVYRTKHMVTLFRGLMSRGVPLSIIVPEKISDMGERVERAKPGGKERKFMLLGTGDIAFPVIFAVSVLSYGLLSSIAVIIGALIGLFSIHLLLMKRKGAIPALPPIVFFSLLAFLITVFLTGGL